MTQWCPDIETKEKVFESKTELYYDFIQGKFKVFDDSSGSQLTFKKEEAEKAIDADAEVVIFSLVRDKNEDS